MALFNHATKEVTAKLVYYGPGLCGKTSNLQWIHGRLPAGTTGKLVSLATQTDRTLFFDFLPPDVGTVRGMRLRLQLYAVPGQVFYENTRRVVLKGCDAVVFVADSQAAMLDANAESLRSLRQNLLLNEVDPEIPQVLQYNKRDLPSALPVAVLNARLNPRSRPWFEAVAARGTGVEETLQGVTRLLFDALVRFYGDADSGAAAIAPPPPSFPGPAPARISPRSATDGAPFRERRGTAAGASTVAPPVGAGLAPGQWVYLADGALRGPVDLDDLIDLVLRTVPEDTWVWREGLEGWTRANEVREVAEEIPPPVPGAAPAGFSDEEMPDFDTVPSMLRTVLIADEDAAFRKFLAMPLAAQGFTIYEAADGAAAWQLAVQNRPWIILADVSLPEVDGFEFCRRVRGHALLSRKPLLFISGSDKYKERYRALQIGADDFLSKSMPVRELLMRIQLLMTRYSDLNARAQAGPGAGAPVAGALVGRIEVFGAPALLQICNQGRLTGTFEAAEGDGAGARATIDFRDGEIVSALAAERRGPEAVYTLLAWQRGSFRFAPGEPGPGEPLAQSVEHLLLEGCRRLDEARAAGAGEPGF